MPQRHIVSYFFFFRFPGFLLQLKAFYVDLIVPLESNIEKDTKVVQVRCIYFASFTFMKEQSYYIADWS